MSDDQRTQPPLPFDPALQLLHRDSADEPEREVSLDTFSSLLFDEFIRRTNQLDDRQSRA
jgi:hypothetical protein